jgi:cell wall-associated NlpC family hydrolase
LAAARDRLATLQIDLQRQRARVSALRADVVSSALADYQNAAGLSTATSILVADDPKDFLQSLATRTIAEQQQSGLLSLLRQQQRKLGIQEQQAQREVAAVADNKSALAASNVQLRRKTEQAEAVLRELRAKQRQRLARIEARQAAFAQAQASRSAQRVSTGDTTQPPSSQGAGAPSGSSSASVAVSYALAQVGDPYVYGAAGPDSFDCSGLTMAAWAAAGVSIPHASSMQPGAGTPVSVSALLPGDLVFFYSPISHVGMYIGNGQIVHSPHTGAYVEVVPLSSMPVTMAVRIG